MTFDGQHVAGEVNGDQFIYRPLRKGERERLYAEMRGMPERIAERWEREVVENRIVVAEWDCSIRDMDDETYRNVATCVLGLDNEQQEQSDEANLTECVRLWESHPWLRNTSCESCRKWLYDPLTGHLHRNNYDGELEPVPRPAGWPLPCDAGLCPKGHWKNPVEMSEKNRLALQCYEETSEPGWVKQVIENAKHSA